jgi:hypothetical protein
MCGTVPASAGAVSVHVQKPNLKRSVHISFRPTGKLPPDGYYYAVMVLRPYRHYTRTSPPPCSTSSDMERADYGYPQSGKPVRLSLTPARSTTAHWCRGGTYTGAIYAVPQAPPCEGKYPCRSEPYEPPSPCWEIAPGRRACGIAVKPGSYAYPDGPPRPLNKGTSIIGHFTVTF